MELFSGLKLYLSVFDTLTLSYGSVGAFIVLLMWLYLSGIAVSSSLLLASLAGLDGQEWLQEAEVQRRTAPWLRGDDSVGETAALLQPLEEAYERARCAAIAGFFLLAPLALTAWPAQCAGSGRLSALPKSQR